MSMMRADWATGAPANDNELRQIEQATGVGASGPYTGSTQDIARQASSMIPGLQTHVYEGLNRQALGAALDQELAHGHTVIAGIKSPYSGDNHYIYVAGKDQSGNYMIGDSGRRGGGLLGPSIGREDLLNRMMARGGGDRMVAGWTDAATPATRLATTAAGRYAFMNRNAPTDPGRGPGTVPPEQYGQGELDPQQYGRPELGPQQYSRDGSPFPPERCRPRESDVPGQPGERHQIRLNGMVVDVPNNLDPSKPINFMTYFNGFGSSYSDEYREKHLGDQMKNAPPNTVLIAARWQDQEHSRNPAHSTFDRNGDLRGVLGQVFQGVPELHRQGLQPGDTLGLSGFSAGYNAVGKVLSDRALASRVTNIVMLDSPSSAVHQFVSDHLGDFANGTRRLSMVAGDWRAADYSQFASSLRQQLQRSGLNEARGISFARTHTAHGSIPGEWFGRAAFEANQ
jgi:hypothetical protein